MPGSARDEAALALCLARLCTSDAAQNREGFLCGLTANDSSPLTAEGSLGVPCCWTPAGLSHGLPARGTVAHQQHLFKLCKTGT